MTIDTKRGRELLFAPDECDECIKKGAEHDLLLRVARELKEDADRTSSEPIASRLYTWAERLEREARSP